MPTTTPVAWAQARAAPVLLVGTEPAIGLTAAHAAELIEWARRWVLPRAPGRAPSTGVGVVAGAAAEAVFARPAAEGIVPAPPLRLSLPPPPSR